MSTSLVVGTAGFGADDPKRILSIRLSHSDGSLSAGGAPTETEGANPGFVCVDGDIAYVGFEDEAGAVQAFSIDHRNQFMLTPLGSPASSTGRHPCYIAKSGRWVLVANYSSGSVAVLPTHKDGSLGLPTDSKAMAGSELIDPSLNDRQEMSHCHSIVPNPVHEKWVVVCDLGLSACFVYELDHERGCLIGAADAPRHMRLTAGAGCRHAVWSADGATLYCNNELDSTVTVASFDPVTGALVALSHTPTLPADVTGTRAHHRGNSDIHLHPSGNFLYVGIRGPDPGLIAVFSVANGGRSLKLVEHVSTRGLVPRNFKLVPGGEDAVWLVVGNQETHTVESYAVDAVTGKLSAVSSYSTSPYKPCNINFILPS